MLGGVEEKEGKESSVTLSMTGEKVTRLGRRGVGVFCWGDGMGEYEERCVLEVGLAGEGAGGVDGGVRGGGEWNAFELDDVGGVDGGVGGKTMPRALSSWDGSIWLPKLDDDVELSVRWDMSGREGPDMDLRPLLATGLWMKESSSSASEVETRWYPLLLDPRLGDGHQSK